MMEDEQMDNNLSDSIVMLEQILEVMPQDVDALKALYNAYCQSGNDERAFEYLGKLTDVVCGGSDSAQAEFIVEELARFEEAYPSEVEHLLSRLLPMIGLTEAHASQGQDDAGGQAAEAEISEELALAWKLYEEDQLSQEEYSSVLHDLTEVSSKEVGVPVSVLHVLNDRGFNQMSRIMNHLSSRSGVPVISLLNFELNEEVASTLPLEIASREGALPFASFGEDLLIAVLNPFNRGLLEKVEKAGDCRCHAYLVSAEEYDIALGKLRSLAA